MRRHSRSLRWHDDRGAALVEFALVVPILCLLVFGMVDFAFAYNARITLSEAAAEGARTLALGGTTDAAKTQIRAALASSTVDPARVTYPEAPTTCPTGAGPTSRAKVTVRYSFSPLTPLIGAITGDIPLSASGGRACSV